MDIRSAFPGTYIKAADLDGDTEFMITGCEEKNVARQGEDADYKPVLEFEGTDQRFALNKTNATAIAEMYGYETDEWTGRKIVLYPTQTQFGAKMVDCVRVKRPTLHANPDVSSGVDEDDIPF